MLCCNSPQFSPITLRQSYILGSAFETWFNISQRQNFLLFQKVNFFCIFLCGLLMTFILCHWCWNSVADPDQYYPYVFGPHGSGSFYHQAKNSKKNIDSYCFVTSLWLLMFEKWCKYIFKKYRNQQLIFLMSLRSLPKIARSASGSICQTYISVDPDPHQNFMDPQHWLKLCCAYYE